MPVFGIIAAGLWLWMAWKTGAGQNWARVLSSVFFGLSCVQLIGGISDMLGSGSKVLALILGLVGPKDPAGGSSDRCRVVFRAITDVPFPTGRAGSASLDTLRSTG